MSDQINIRVPSELKKKIQEKGIDCSRIAREALENAVGGVADLQKLMGGEEELFSDWADSFAGLYAFAERRLAERENMTLSEIKTLEGVWEKIQSRMKTREELLDEIPEIAAMTYEDCFDWEKLIALTEKYPKVKGKLGVVIIREALVFREVKAGRFKTFQETREKMNRELEARAKLVDKMFQDKLNTKEFRRDWLIKQEELRLEEVRKNQPGASA